MLFLPNDHSDLKYAVHGEPLFSYLNRSGREECFRVRAVLQRWFSNYPTDAQEELRMRFQSNDDTALESSFFELYLNELLLSLGYLTEVHPIVSELKTTRPDFRATAPDGSEIIIEATFAKGMAAIDEPENKRKQLVLNEINILQNENFSLVLRQTGSPQTQPRVRGLRESLRKWLSSLDPTRCSDLVEAGLSNELPQMSWSHEGWKLTFVAWPLSNAAKKRSDRRLIVLQSEEWRRVDSVSPLQRKIRSKASRYGELDIPYVIAVNFNDNTLDSIDIGDALFGQEVFQVIETSESELRLEPRRRPDGAWRGPQGPHNTRVSAVLLFKSLSPWSIAACEPELFLNPWAKIPCTGPICKLPKQVPERGAMKKESGLHPRILFDLPESWPMFTNGE